jgi:hypothetical protein
MSFVIARFSHDPIVLVQISLAEYDTASFACLQDQLDYLARDVAPLVMILGLSDQEINFSDVLLFLDYCEDHPHGTPADPRIYTILLNQHPMIPVIKKRFQARFERPLEQANRMEDALRLAQNLLGPPTSRNINDS